MTGTKWELFKVAMDLFAAGGYANVSIRDIAAAVGLNPASIYNHFPSKDAFLTEAYNFYERNYYEQLPTLESLIELVPERSPQEIWRMMTPVYEDELLDLMTKIILVAIDERRRDPNASTLIHEVFTKVPSRYITALLEEMIRLDMIESIDIAHFVSLYSAFNLFASTRIGSIYPLSKEEWQGGLEFLLSLLRFK